MKKRRNFTEVLLILLTVLVFLAVFTVILALIYPSATKNIIADISQGSESNQGGPIGVMGQVVKRAAEGFNARIAPAVNWIGKRIADLLSRKKPGGTIVENEEPPIKVADCTGCHKKLFDQRANSNIYVDHRLHEAADIDCRKCHLNTKHPKPRVVKQAACIDCHEQSQASTACADCHPPGSILDSAVIPQEKTDEFLHNASVSTKSLVPHNFGRPDPAWLKGEGDAPCSNCHEVPEFCNKCHLVFHDEIPDWPLVHGGRLLRQEYVMNVCWTCHSATWCAGNCHLSPGVVRKGAYLELPAVPLETYIR